MSASNLSTMNSQESILLFYTFSRIVCLKELINTQDKARRAILREKINNLFKEERNALTLLKSGL